VNLWRIAAETRRYTADDLSGAGAARSPGRWNGFGEPVLYCAPTVGVAVLETAAHVDDAGLPQNRYLVEIAVPDSIWAAREEATAASLPDGWDAIPAGIASDTFGSAWIRAGRSVILLVPSAIVPEEWIAVVNPRHPEAGSLSARKLRRFEYSKLFRTRRS
jgi:RES domain-containing protein